MHVDYSVELGRDDPVLELPWSSEDAALRYLDLKACPELLLQIPEASAHPELAAFLARVNMAGFPLQTAKCDAWHSREILPEEEIFGADCKFVSYVDLVFANQDARLSFEKHEELAQTLCRLLRRAPDIAAAVEFAIRRCYYHDHRDTLPSPRSGDVSQGNVTTAPAGSSSPQDARAGGGADLPSAPHCIDQQQSEGELCEAQTSGAEGVVGHSCRADERRAVAHSEDSGHSQSGFYLTVYVTGFGDSVDEAGKRWAITLTLVQHALVQMANT